MLRLERARDKFACVSSSGVGRIAAHSSATAGTEESDSAEGATGVVLKTSGVGIWIKALPMVGSWGLAGVVGMDM